HRHHLLSFPTRRSSDLRLVEHPVCKLALLVNRLDHPRPNDLEQSRDDDHYGRLRLLDVRDELLKPLAVIDLGADHDREELSARIDRKSTRLNSSHVKIS